MNILQHINQTRPDVSWVLGPDNNGAYTVDTTLENQSNIHDLILSFDESQPEPINQLELKIFKYVNEYTKDKTIPPFDLDFVTGLTVKLHRKSTIIKGECTEEEYFANYDGSLYSDLIVKEETLYIRDALGFPISKTASLIWYRNNSAEHESKKTWVKYYSNLEKIQEGKTRRGNLVSNLQMPCIGLISIAMTGAQDPTTAVILEGRRFLADYSKEFTVFIEDSNRDIVQCLSDSNHSKYAHQSNYTWIDTMTPYGITIRQFIISELTI